MNNKSEEQQAACGTYTSSVVCNLNEYCHYCRFHGPASQGGCFETTTLYKCPRSPDCTRVAPEKWGVEIGALGWFALCLFIPLALYFIITTCVTFFAIREKRWLRAQQQGNTDLTTTALLENNTSPVTANNNNNDTPIFIIIPSPHQEPRFHKLAIAARRIAFTAFLFVVFIVFLYNPSNPRLSVCDARWNVAEARNSGQLDLVDLELLVSIYNPNRFDLVVQHAQGTLLFHSGALAEFSFTPKRSGGEARIGGGHVYDTRVVLKIETRAIEEVVRLVTDYVSKEGIVLTLNLDAFFELVLFGITTPKMAIGSQGLEIYLNQADRRFCACSTSDAAV